MTVRESRCRCGALTARCTGEPVRVSVCHCLDCQRRSGSAFAHQARWPKEQVAFAGEASEWSHRGDSGDLATFRFCPTCGTTISYRSEGLPDLIAIPIGTFADPDFPPPHYSVFETRKHRWLTVEGEGIEHYD